MQKVVLSLLFCLVGLNAKNFHAEIQPVSRETLGATYHDGCPVPAQNLRLLRLDFFDERGLIQKGELIVHEEVSKEVVEIFQSLFKAKFPIAKMQLISDFNASDEASMAANNTSAFNCRFIAGTRKYSKHSYGKAIDINPLWNPCVMKEDVSPKNAIAFVARGQAKSGMIKRDDSVVKLFAKYGWKWGGAWKSLKDYQHFEKEK